MIILIYNLAFLRIQSTLLDYSISNLQQSLLWGGILAFLMLFIFLRDIRSPWLIGITIPLSIVVSLLVFYLADISINIISLSGLVLGVGLMIDNAIIVIDNITQLRLRGFALSDACIKGTNEVMRPLISSALTTSAVFIPLIFLSGISGALFFDQAVAIAIGLGVSLAVSILVLPPLYKLIYPKKRITKLISSQFTVKNGISTFIYEKGLGIIFRYPFVFLLSLLLITALGFWLSSNMRIQRLPEVQQRELILHLDWNEPIHLEESQKRVNSLLTHLAPFWKHSDTQIGIQQFLLNSTPEQKETELSIHMQTHTPEALQVLQDTLTSYLQTHYPRSPYSISPPPNLFERLFADNVPALLVQISKVGQTQSPDIQLINHFIQEIGQSNGMQFPSLSSKAYQVIQADLEKLALYKVSPTMLLESLQSAFSAREIGSLSARRKEIPIFISGPVQSIQEILTHAQVSNFQGILIPVSQLVNLKAFDAHQTLSGGKSGEYVPIPFDIQETQLHDLLASIHIWLQSHRGIDVQIKGSLLSGSDLLFELGWVLGIALLMLYFILAAQFESLTQPLIVLLEIPIDLAAAILVLWISSASLNLMSMIGMIVMSGIIINDSILKIDTINRLVREGKSVKEAIYMGGHRRLIPILMTSLTTIFAVVPFLFIEGLGADIQKPLALAIIGGMTVGTFVSLFFIPLAYRLLHRLNTTNTHK